MKVLHGKYMNLFNTKSYIQLNSLSTVILQREMIQEQRMVFLIRSVFSAGEMKVFNSSLQVFRFGLPWFDGCVGSVLLEGYHVYGMTFGRSRPSLLPLKPSLILVIYSYVDRKQSNALTTATVPLLLLWILTFQFRQITIIITYQRGLLEKVFCSHLIYEYKFTSLTELVGGTAKVTPESDVASCAILVHSRDLMVLCQCDNSLQIAVFPW